MVLPLDVEKIGRGDLTLAIALYDSVTNRAVSPESNGCAGKLVLSDSNAMLTDLLTLPVPPGSYHLTVKAENVSSNRVSLLRQVIAVEPYGDSELQISDPVLAAQIDETDVDDSFRRKNLRVLPLPTRAFLVGQEMGLYFEVYNLVAGRVWTDALSRYASDCGFGTGRGFANAADRAGCQSRSVDVV